ncbi:hypothetical protein [Helicobacter kayseriensis]|uniref:hypothetical protein n=1 Tax=Helicobacter kayseriensis TaxID=2905877 RepID=UPI001E52DE91|nr:hypothetical protein [Helicobacter kayseriensis]MCE3046473.1 hypothetical protein [Helicobacter kayseriensis]MCE3048224.1 hypothetical protein [Helicobacter kayseriensis]
MKKYLLLTILSLNAFAIDKIEQDKKSLIEIIKDKEKKIAVPRETVPVEESKFLMDRPIPKTAHHLPFLQTLLSIQPGTLPNPIGISFIGSHVNENYSVKKFNAQTGPTLSKIPGIGTLFSPNEQEWKLSEGRVETTTSAIGIKADMFLFPFMQIFVSGAYLHMEQKTTVGSATIPFAKDANKVQQGLLNLFLKPMGGNATKNNMTVPIAPIQNSLDGWLVMAGTNLAIGYKGFFASFMISGGYVQLDDHANNVTGFVQKPFMYLAPRIGYSYHGIITAHVGVQRIELFGATKGKDLSQSTGGLVSGYSVEIEKFPVNFLAGLQFMFARDLGVAIEYVGSPDTKGINAELAFRF